jgi:RNA-directed DNA polymerase
MTAVATRAGAFSHTDGRWTAINWRQAHQNVRRLQARIVKATQAGRWGKVKALQHLLTHSFSGRALAVRRVTENQGKRTPGVDRQVWNTPEKKMEAIGTLKRRGYQPLPLRRVYISKSNGRLRPLSIPVMKDRAMQALYLLGLDPIAETTADPNSYGFRKGRSTADAIGQCFNALARKTSASYILECDIKSCFDEISHSWLLAHIPMDKRILHQWLKAGFMDRSILYPTDRGTPQGGVASPVLMNLTLDGLEKLLEERFAPADRVHYIRFADDIAITGKSQELLETRVKPLVEDFLQVRGLSLSPDKTSITQIEEGFDFLGQNVRKYKGKLMIKPSTKNVKAFLAKVRAKISPQQTSAGELIAQLNPIIRGWANYHQHIVSKRMFVKVDDFIYQWLWQWARRRHPGKPHRWIKRKYFTTRGGDYWVFFGELKRKDGTRRQIFLFNAASVRIRRHCKIKGAANPYDPAMETYFERRLDAQMSTTLQGHRQLLSLWKEQEGRCLVCQQPITRVTGWHRHHRIWLVNGGADTIGNLVLLHPTCHHQVHSRDSAVVKPRPSKGVEKGLSGVP